MTFSVCEVKYVDGSWFQPIVSTILTAVPLRGYCCKTSVMLLLSIRSFVPNSEIEIVATEFALRTTNLENKVVSTKRLYLQGHVSRDAGLFRSTRNRTGHKA